MTLCARFAPGSGYPTPWKNPAMRPVGVATAVADATADAGERMERHGY